MKISRYLLFHWLIWLLLLAWAMPVAAVVVVQTHTPDNRPFLQFNIYQQGEEFGSIQYVTVGQKSAFSLDANEQQCLVYAADYWGHLLGAGAGNSQYLNITVGTFAEQNYDSTSNYIQTGPQTGYYELPAAILFDYYNDEVLSQLRLGYLHAGPHSADMQRLSILPLNSGGNELLSTIIAHELGHSMGISSLRYIFTDNGAYMGIGFGPLLGRWNESLYDSKGQKAQSGMLISSVEGPGRFYLMQGGYAFFQGPEVMKVLDGAILGGLGNPYQVGGLPINGWEGNIPELGHIELARSMMSHQNYRNWGVYMEAELAALQDIGLPIDRKNFYGFSLYKDNATVYNTSGYFARGGGVYLPGQYNDTPWGIGLHIYGSNNTVYQQADILSSGWGGAGARVDGLNNTLVIDPGVKVHAHGDEAVGIMAAYGNNHNLVLRGEVAAVHGLGARFDFGNNCLGNDSEYRGSYIWSLYDSMNQMLPDLNGPLVKNFDVSGALSGGQAAIYISENALVERISIMHGAQLNGDIISHWDAQNPQIHYLGPRSDLITQLDFGRMAGPDGKSIAGSVDPDFRLRYQGDIHAPQGMAINVLGGKLAYHGNMDIVDFTLADQAGLLPIMADSASVISAQNIDLQAGSFLSAVPPEYSYADYGQGSQVLLSLHSQELNNQSTLVQPEVFAANAYDYITSLHWQGSSTLLADVSRVLNPERGAVSSVTAPLAIAASMPMGDILSKRAARLFRAYAGSQDEQLQGQHAYGLRRAYQVADSGQILSDEQPLWTIGPTGDAQSGMPGRALWITPAYSYTQQSGPVGYDIKTPVWSMGFDHWLNDNFFLGLALSAALPQYESSASDIDAKNLGIAVHMGTVLPYELQLQLFAAYSHGTYDQQRKVHGLRYSSDFNSDNYSLGLNLGRNFSLAEGWELRPFAGYELMYLDVDGFNESGGIYALNMDSSNYTLHRFNLGTDIAYNARNGAYVAGRIYYAGIYGDREGQADGFFVMDPARHGFTSIGDALDEHSLGLGLSAGLPLGEALELSAGYNFLVGQDSKNHQASLGLVIKF